MTLDVDGLEKNTRDVTWFSGTYDDLFPELRELVDAAAEARNESYSPYSGYRVGAAVRNKRGEIYSAANVELVVFDGMTHAEQAACNNMMLDRDVPQAERKLTHLACVAQNGGVPCGGCLQTITEFCENRDAVIVGMEPDSRKVIVTTLENLTPLSRFDPDSAQNFEP